MVRVLLADPRIDPRAGDLCALAAACEHGRLQVVQLLLADGRVDPAARKNAALMSALSSRSWDVVMELLQCPSVDPSAGGNAAIRAATEDGKADVLARLLGDPRVDATAGAHHCLRAAAQKNDCLALGLLLACDRVRRTLASDALISSCQAAAQLGHLEALHVLLSQLPLTTLSDPAAVYRVITSLASFSTAPALRLVLEDAHVGARASGEGLRAAAARAADACRPDLVALLMADERFHSDDDGVSVQSAMPAVYGRCLRNPLFARQVFLADARSARAVRAALPVAVRPAAVDRAAIVAAVTAVAWRRRAAAVLARAAAFYA